MEEKKNLLIYIFTSFCNYIWKKNKNSLQLL